MKKIIILVAFFIATISLHSLMLSGVVMKKDSSAIPGATIRVENTVLGAVADKNGKFKITQLKEGEYTLVVTSVGHEPVKKQIKVDNRMDSISFIMSESINLTNEVVVTGNRTDRIYNDLPIRVSVVDNRIFEATRSMNLSEGINFQPGLRVENTCQNCGFVQVRLNGLDGHYSQILIDGRPVFSSLNGVYGLEQIPANMIDRVEVIRGGGSSLYGGNAVGGVVNIITREPMENSFNFNANRAFINDVARDDVLQMNTTIISENQKSGIFINGMSRNQEAYDHNGDGFTEINEMSVLNLGARAFYKPDNVSKFNLEINVIDDERRGGNKLNLPFHETDIAEATSHNTYIGNVNYERFLNKNNGKIAVYTSFQNTERDSYYGANQDPNAYGNTINSTVVSGAQFSQVIPSSFGEHLITTGYEFRYDGLEDIYVGYNREIRQYTREHGFYFQDDWKLNDIFSFVLGARLDKHSMLNDPVFNPRMNLMVKPIDNLSIRGSFSTGFRAPQAFDEDLHISFVNAEPILNINDPNLKPEYSTSISLSTEYSVKLFNNPVVISAEFFRTKLDDVFILNQIEGEKPEYEYFQRTNGAGAVVQGGTFELFTQGNYFSFKSGFTVQSGELDKLEQWSEDAAPTKELFRMPDWHGYAMLSTELFDEYLRMSLSGLLTGPMRVPHFAGYIENDEIIESEIFLNINLNADILLFKSLNLYLNIGAQNIFNSYQNNFDSGIDRDAGFIYGPVRPRTYFIGFKTSL
jgi:outer membrane receptor for ferrienterochelin and colicins